MSTHGKGRYNRDKFNLFVRNVPFFYPLETSENRKVF